MQLATKQGYILVSPVNSNDYAIELLLPFQAGKIAVGNPADLGVVVYFKEYQDFNQMYWLVKTDDVLVWLKPVEIKEEVVADEPKVDQA